MERTQQVGASASHSRSSAAVRPSKKDRTSNPSARSGVAVSPRSSLRAKVVEEASVGARLGVMELVDDHDVEGVARDVVDAVGRQRLHAGEHVLPPLGASAADVELAEVAVA